MKDIDIFLDAVEVAKLSVHPAARVGVSVYVNRKIISRAFNTGALHAEIRAINNAPRMPIRDCILAIARIWKTGELANSLPCPRCLAYLKARKVGKIVAFHAGEIVSFLPGDEAFKRPPRPWNTPKRKEAIPCSESWE